MKQNSIIIDKQKFMDWFSKGNHPSNPFRAWDDIYLYGREYEELSFGERQVAIIRLRSLADQCEELIGVLANEKTDR
jgi:hypothetical protein